MSRKTWAAGMMIPLAAAAVFTAPAATAVVPPGPVSFGVAAVQDIGACTGRERDLRRSDVALDARTTLRGRITLNLRLVNSDRARQAWRVRITQNGAVIAAENAFTRPLRRPVRVMPGGNTAVLTVRKVVRNMRGVDRFVARATNLRTRETCTVRVVVRR